MLISLIHATRRPQEGKECQKRWLDLADNRARIEIVTAVDADDDASREAFPDAIVVYGSQGCCPAYNAAAAKSTGDILIQLDDDNYPPAGWDSIVESYMCNGADILHVGDKHRKDELICHVIISRKYYETIGFFHHGLFRSVYSDNYHTTLAKNWGYIDASKGGTVDLGWEHRNPSRGFGEEDEVARISNSKERYAEGSAIMERLTKDNFILAFTAFNRPEYLKQSLDSWLKTNLSLVTSVQFFIEPSDRLPDIHAVIDAFAKECPVPVIKHVNPEKYGVLRNPWELFRNLFEYQLATFVILGEDDFIVSPDTLDFFEATRKQLQPKTLAICAKNTGESSDNEPSTFTYDNGFSGNVWGLYAEKWRTYLRHGWDSDYSSGKADNTPGGWDWNISLRVMPQNGLRCLVPTASRSFHVGLNGVHCTAEDYNATTTPNFVREKFVGTYQEKGVIGVIKPKKIATKVITTAGDLGDAICCLPAIISRGEVVNFLLRDNGQTKGIVGRMHLIKDLLESQPLIAECRAWREGEQVDWPSEEFRRMGMHGNGDSLAGVHSACARRFNYITKEPDYSKAWLVVEPDNRWNDRVVINRTDRYANPYFPWGKIMQHYGPKIAFIGTPHEHDMFQRSFGLVEFVPTANLLIAAKMIAGSALYIGNQSSCMVIAEGLKHPRIQESCLWLPDCIYPGSNAQYVGDGGCTLPAIGDTPELVIEATRPVEVNIHDTPPGMWQFPGCPPMPHYAPMLNFMRQANPEWSKAEALEQLKDFNRKRVPEFYNNGLDSEMRKFMVAKRNAGLA